jgi:hypothetical protein
MKLSCSITEDLSWLLLSSNLEKESSSGLILGLSFLLGDLSKSNVSPSAEKSSKPTFPLDLCLGLNSPLF